MFPSFQLSVVASQRAATTETLKYPDKTTLIHKVLLYMDVQRPPAAPSTHINTGERISQAGTVALANCFRAADIGIGRHGEDTVASTDTQFWFQSLLRKKHKWRRELLTPHGKRVNDTLADKDMAVTSSAVQREEGTVNRGKNHRGKDLSGTDRGLNKVPLMR